MQAIKNALHSNKSHDETSGSATGLNNNTTTSGLNQNTTTGSTIGDSQHSGLVSGNNQSGLTSGLTGDATNASATRGTGLTGTSHADSLNTGAGRSTGQSSQLDHGEGHNHSIASKFDPSAENVTHDHKHLQHVVHADHRHVEVEEVERQREVDRHVHHVQHHVQPVIDKQVKPEQLRENIVPVTNIQEKHASTNEDKALLAGLASQHKDTETHRGKERTVVDLGEKVHENTHHHVHHVTQPVIEQEVVERERIHTVIPVHQTTHEAPIIHKSSTHEPVTLDSFLSGGGKLGSGITHENAGVLSDAGCAREVDGPAEALAAKLHLNNSDYSSRPTRRRGLKHGVQRTNSMSSVSSSDEENGVRTTRTQKREKKGLMTKAKEAVSGHKDTNTTTTATR